MMLENGDGKIYFTKNSRVSIFKFFLVLPCMMIQSRNNSQIEKHFRDYSKKCNYEVAQKYGINEKSPISTQ